MTLRVQDNSNKIQFDLDTLRQWRSAWEVDLKHSQCQTLHIARGRYPTDYK